MMNQISETDARQSSDHSLIAYSQPRKKRIMIVDDDVDFRLMLSELLVLQGYSITTARDGESGLCKLNEEGDLPDLIVLDLSMPQLDGWEFCQERMRQPHLSKIPVIMISGHLIPPTLAEVNGVDACISKPFDVFEVLDLVERIVPQQGGDHVKEKAKERKKGHPQ